MLNLVDGRILTARSGAIVGVRRCLKFSCVKPFPRFPGPDPCGVMMGMEKSSVG